ncbi:hypothetical protein [Phytohabitans houttuyneae]|uniref:Uncharacterized protein n=1 Tax=Phytohabitans houttuyneae TaxID=1076126 RepID=A0A6V8KIA0_9ACTN|nr:hypothetical protein [Phytohabitans houttuyneae]GFJ81829.1 hypothetical protein Phou_060090 [Phytohabitans houttuyneae]
MQESDVRTMLEATAAAPAPPSAVDLDRAVRDGRRTRTTRRALLAGATAFGVAAVTGGAVVALRPSQRGETTDPAATTPPARAWPPRPNGALGGPTLPGIPSRFDLLGQWAVFGWLPFDPATVSWRVMNGYVDLTAETDQTISVNLFRGPEVAEEALRMGGTAVTAPPVAGQQARWVSRRDAVEEWEEVLQWRYVPGHWAQVRTTQRKAGHPMPTGSARREMLHRVASSVGLSATRRQRFPFRTTALPDDLPLFRVEVITGADGTWDASIYSGQRDTIQHSSLSIAATKTARGDGLGEPIPPADLEGSAISRSDVDGHPAFRTRTASADELSVRVADDVTVSVAAKGESVQLLGPDGALGLYRNIEVLTDPAAWTDDPI